MIKVLKFIGLLALIAYIYAGIRIFNFNLGLGLIYSSLFLSYLDKSTYYIKNMNGES